MLKYTTEELDKILNKEVEIVLGEIDDDDDFSFKGKIISYNIENESTNNPSDFCFHTVHGAIKTFNISSLKNIKILDH